MKVSLNTIKYYQDKYKWPDITGVGVEKLVEKIGAQLGAVEEVIDLGRKYQGIVIAKVVECMPLDGSDHLNVCRIDDGKVTKDVERDDDGLVQVVCGAPNCRPGITVAWLPPGTTVPASFEETEPFVLTARELRGVKSNGMLASPKELALGDSHEGLLLLDEGQPGDDFATVIGLKDDVIIDIENKMFTHRPDCFGVFGISRELAGIQGVALKSPEWYVPQPAFPSAEGTNLPLKVQNELPELVPRFTAVVMSDVQVGPSPSWLQVELTKLGIKSINNIVDYTNYFMLETGQPLHAYDYDKLKALSGDETTIVVRNPKPGEKIKLLNGKEVEPRAEAIMIATDKQLIAMGGVMGGTDTEVGPETKNIIIECATFDMYSVRRTSMAHGLFTDGVTRFTKGQSPLQNLAVLYKIVYEIQKFADGKVASAVIDDNHLDKTVLERGSLYPAVKVTTEFVNDRLGVELSAADMKTLLENVEFRVDISGDELTVAAPFWRTDIELREDVVEEIGRLYGYDHVPLTLPKRDLTPAVKQPLLELKQQIRETLVRAGANELLTYSFVHGDLLTKVGQNAEQAFTISNALSPDLQYYRLSLTPSLLEKVHPNIKAGYDQFALFELGKSHYVDEWDEAEPEVPNEDDHLALVVAYGDKQKPQGTAYYLARKYLTDVDESLAADLVPMTSFNLESDDWGKQLAAPYEPNRSALIVRDKQIWGVVGEFKPSVRRALKLPEYAAGFEVHLDAVNPKQPNYLTLLRFPSVKQDITLKVAADKSFTEVYSCTDKALGINAPDDSHIALEPIGIYQSPDDMAHKHYSFRVKITGLNRTLTDKEVTTVLDAIAAEAQTKLGAERL